MAIFGAPAAGGGGAARQSGSSLAAPSRSRGGGGGGGGKRCSHCGADMGSSAGYERYEFNYCSVACMKEHKLSGAG